MKIMIIGDSASGKSTFAIKLGQKLGIPVIHIDEINDSLGRENYDEIRKVIEKEIQNKDWIFDGNGLSKDNDARIKNCDVLFLFNSNPFVTLYRQIARHLKIKTGKERRVGAEDSNLNLNYFIPYIFFQFPKRKRNALILAQSLDKKIYIFNNKKDISSFLAKMDKNSDLAVS